MALESRGHTKQHNTTNNYDILPYKQAYKILDKKEGPDITKWQSDAHISCLIITLYVHHDYLVDYNAHSQHLITSIQKYIHTRNHKGKDDSRV